MPEKSHNHPHFRDRFKPIRDNRGDKYYLYTGKDKNITVEFIKNSSNRDNQDTLKLNQKPENIDPNNQTTDINKIYQELKTLWNEEPLNLVTRLETYLGPNTRIDPRLAVDVIAKDSNFTKGVGLGATETQHSSSDLITLFEKNIRKASDPFENLTTGNLMTTWSGAQIASNIIPRLEYRDSKEIVRDFLILVDSGYNEAATQLINKAFEQITPPIATEKFSDLGKFFNDMMDLYAFGLEKGLIKEEDIKVPQEFPVFKIYRDLIVYDNEGRTNNAINEWGKMINDEKVPIFMVNLLFKRDLLKFIHNETANDNNLADFIDALESRIEMPLNDKELVRDLKDLFHIMFKAGEARLIDQETINLIKNRYSLENSEALTASFNQILHEYSNFSDHPFPKFIESLIDDKGKD
ncbi:MAG: hypothetical protein MK033_05740 [Candidatus Caenarcaniphilales bacterium]|nr:hypothetical protein [Candidatus Caenarcaniphilales bacterium]